MKYMGSKRAMLKNSLGEILANEAANASRLVDLFCGSGTVSWHAAKNFNVQVFACDLQRYAAILASAVIERKQPACTDQTSRLWLGQARRIRTGHKNWACATQLDTMEPDPKTWRRHAQQMCSVEATKRTSVIWRCYGGHYFSPTQAMSFDAMLSALPSDKQLRNLCLAATIIAASQCAAAPGHTAQPFKATPKAGKYLREAWLRDPFYYAQKALEQLCPLYANKRGKAEVADANLIAKKLKPDDVVFVDPPYSAVQYSRFYHVLETIARGKCDKVEGVGRYPILKERPDSSYSKTGASRGAIEDLLYTLKNSECTVILTFPLNLCSNGLSGQRIEEMARELFSVSHKAVITSAFSTLGGNNTNRTARKKSEELVLVLKKRKRRSAAVNG